MNQTESFTIKLWMSTVSRAADLYGLSCGAWTRPSWIKSTFQECRGCRSYISLAEEDRDKIRQMQNRFWGFSTWQSSVFAHLSAVVIAVPLDPRWSLSHCRQDEGPQRAHPAKYTKQYILWISLNRVGLMNRIRLRKGKQKIKHNWSPCFSTIKRLWSDRCIMVTSLGHWLLWYRWFVPGTIRSRELEKPWPLTNWEDDPWFEQWNGQWFKHNVCSFTPFFPPSWPNLQPAMPQNTSHSVLRLCLAGIFGTVRT